MSRTTRFVMKCVACPYYTSESPVEIKCRDRNIGLCGDCTMSIFRDKASKDYHKEDFCNGYYKNCPIYLAFEEGE